MHTVIDYSVRGIQVFGEGSFSQGALHLVLRSRDTPLDFDPALLFVCGVDALIALGAGLAQQSEDGEVVARTRADFLGEGGSEVGSLVALSRLAQKRGRLACRVQISRYRIAAEIGERPMALSERTVLAAGHPSEVLTLSWAGTVATSRGREWCLLVSSWIQADGAFDCRSMNLPTYSIEHARTEVRATIILQHTPAARTRTRQGPA